MIDTSGQVKAYSGQGHFLGNFVAFLLLFGLLVGSIASIAFWELDQAWLPGLAFLALYTATFLIAKELIGRSDTLDEQDLHGEHGEPLDAMASREAESAAPRGEPKAPAQPSSR